MAKATKICCIPNRGSTFNYFVYLCPRKPEFALYFTHTVIPLTTTLMYSSAWLETTEEAASGGLSGSSDAKIATSLPAASRPEPRWANAHPCIGRGRCGSLMAPSSLSWRDSLPLALTAFHGSRVSSRLLHLFVHFISISRRWRGYRSRRS